MNKANYKNFDKKVFFWKSKRLYKKSFVVGDGKSTSSKLKTFGYSMLIGLTLMFTFIFIIYGNPFDAFVTSIDKIISSVFAKDALMINIGILGLAGIAVAVGFKAGLFNMGVSGQMMFGGFVSGIFATHVGEQIPSVVGQILVLVLTVSGAMLFAGIAGLLKAYFRVHEVVSTITLNWIAFLLMRAVVKDLTPNNLLSANHDRTIDFSNNYMFKYETQTEYGPMMVGGIIAIILFVIAAIMVWILLYKTTLGHKMQMVGKNKDAALAAGINVKRISIISMVISGAVAGLLGVVVYFIKQGNLAPAMVDAIPMEGFNGIAISILAFSNPIAILPITVLFGILQALILNNTIIDPTMVDLIMGIILMVVALSALFIKWNLRLLIHKWIVGKQRHEIYLSNIEKISEIDSRYYEIYENLKLEKKQNKLLKDDWSKILLSQVVYPHTRELLNFNLLEKIQQDRNLQHSQILKKYEGQISTLELIKGQDDVDYKKLEKTISDSFINQKNNLENEFISKRQEADRKVQIKLSEFDKSLERTN